VPGFLIESTAQMWNVTCHRALGAIVLALSATQTTAQSSAAINKLCEKYDRVPIYITRGVASPLSCERISWMTNSLSMRETTFAELRQKLHKYSELDMLSLRTGELPSGCQDHLREPNPRMVCSSWMVGFPAVIEWRLTVFGYPDSITLHVTDVRPVFGQLAEALRAKAGWDAVLPSYSDLVLDIFILKNISLAPSNEFYEREGNGFRVTILNTYAGQPNGVTP
jgi:hypothetical protein